MVERIGHDAVVRVSTIHDFLWEVIAPHQKALKDALLKFNAGLGDRSSRKKDPDELAAALPDVAVNYSDTGSNFLKGRLFHDDLLGVARIMFADSPLLCRLTTARHPYLFVDEYQDTSPAVIDIALGNLLPSATKASSLACSATSCRTSITAVSTLASAKSPPHWPHSFVRSKRLRTAVAPRR
ncbi:hypothetical protein ACXIUS_12410 [Bosea thiooxidans]